MSGKKQRFQSLSDAGDALKRLGQQLAAKATPREQAHAPAAKPAPPANHFAEVEQELLQKAPARPPRAAATKVPPAVKRAKKRNKAKQAAKTILRAPGLMKAYLEHLAKERQAEQDAVPKKFLAPVDPRTLARAAFVKVTELVGRSSPAIEPRPLKVSPKTRATITQAVEDGAAAYAASPQPDLENGFIVGCDFGTSSLKLAVRQPYKAGDPVVMMPVPSELQSGSHPYLWQTALWFNAADQSFSMMPGTGFEVLEGFKTGIIGGHGGERVHAGAPVTRSEAAVAFLALQMAHFFGWYRASRPLGEAGGERPLSVNIGIPVAAQDDHRAFSDFKRIVRAASSLVPEAGNLTLPRVREVYLAAGDSLPPGWLIIPELTAAVAGYAASPTSQSGAHVLVDVGASTLDIVAFNLIRNERIAVISAAVELLGSASLDLALANDISADDFSRACNHQFDEVFLRRACDPARGANGFHPARRGREVQLVTTGGGCESAVHKPFIGTLTKPIALGPLPVLRPVPPAQSVAKSCDLSRLLLAFGLTRDIPELLELRLPSQVPSIPPKPPGPDLYVSKDMT